MNIILTGATGTLGSRILYELLELHSGELEKIYLLVRGRNQLSPEDRVKNILLNQFAPNYIKRNSQAITQKIRVINFGEMPEPLTFLEGNNNYFIHAAGYVNLSVDAKSKTEIFKENFLFTKDIFKAFHPYVNKFIYISTAFSIGDLGGRLGNDYLRIQPTSYRNYYEEAKHLTEIFLAEEGAKKNVAIQILRPSVLGGNIIDQPNYFIAKYMVFYLFAKFFYNAKSKGAVRIALNTNATLNIIPTDYAAKVIARVFRTSIKQLNIVHSQGTNVAEGISTIFDTVGFEQYHLTDEAVSSSYQTKLEKFYYQTIGIHLHPYLRSKPHVWDTSLLEGILPIPAYNLGEYIANTIAFAKTRNFKNERW